MAPNSLLIADFSKLRTISEIRLREIEGVSFRTILLLLCSKCIESEVLHSSGPLSISVRYAKDVRCMGGSYF